MNIKEQAKLYESKHTKNIVELEVVFCDSPISLEQSVNSDGENFEYNYIEQNGERYRVPNMVLSQIKAIEEGLNSSGLTLKNFKVHKNGEGKSTKYQVIALENEKLHTENSIEDEIRSLS